MFHTDHVVELVAKLLLQVEAQNDLSAPVHVSDKYETVSWKFIIFVYILLVQRGKNTFLKTVYSNGIFF